MPMHRRLPKRGFNNVFRVEYAEINLDRLQDAIDAKTIDAGRHQRRSAGEGRRAAPLQGRRAAARPRRAQGQGQIEVHGASKSAIAAVEKAGGSVKILAPAKEEGEAA